MLDSMILQELLEFLRQIVTPIIAPQNFELLPKLAFNESFELYEFFKTLSFLFPKITYFFPREVVHEHHKVLFSPY